jgi:hypothetical protein
MKKTKLKLKPWVLPTFIGLILLFIFLGLMNILENDMEKHIERVSQECALQGYGIKAKYTKEGDKYYVCNK